MSDKILDVNDFMERVQNDKELLFELLDIFIRDFQKKRQDLEEAIRKKDHQTIEHVAHFLKGSCGNISAQILRSIFHELEKKGSAHDMDGLEGYMDAIDKNFEKLMICIGELRTKS